MGESERYQLSIAHTSKRASNTRNTSHNAARSKSYIGAHVNWILFLLFRKRGGITFSPHPSNGTGHFSFPRQSGVTYPSHLHHTSTINDITNITISRSQRYLPTSTLYDTNNTQTQMILTNA